MFLLVLSESLRNASPRKLYRDAIGVIPSLPAQRVFGNAKMADRVGTL